MTQKLYIQIKNGEPYQHPIAEENLIEAWANLDLKNLPVWLAYFERVNYPERPFCGPYDKEIKEIYYIKPDGVVTERFEVIPMTSEEKIAKQDAVKAEWAALDPPGAPSWVFNEDTCQYEAPVKYPNDGLMYVWNEDTTSWDRINAQP
tara:strand:+ start:394 stop:837 length:444 start_codon:yes stop_codon:yes gene_type:complete